MNCCLLIYLNIIMFSLCIFSCTNKSLASVFKCENVKLLALDIAEFLRRGAVLLLSTLFGNSVSMEF